MLFLYLEVVLLPAVGQMNKDSSLLNSITLLFLCNQCLFNFSCLFRFNTVEKLLPYFYSSTAQSPRKHKMKILTKILATKIFKIFKTFYFRKLSIFDFSTILCLHLFQRFLGACKEEHMNTSKNKEVVFWAWLKEWIFFRISSKVTESFFLNGPFSLCFIKVVTWVKKERKASG